MFSSRQNVFCLFFLRFVFWFGSNRPKGNHHLFISRLRLNIIVTWLIYLTQFMFSLYLRYSRLICIETGFTRLIRKRSKLLIQNNPGQLNRTVSNQTERSFVPKWTIPEEIGPTWSGRSWVKLTLYLTESGPPRSAKVTGPKVSKWMVQM